MDAARAEALVVEMREIFAFCDRDYDGKLGTDETVEAIRALGFAPSETQLGALKETVKRVYPTGLTFANFIKVLGSVVEPKVMRASDAGPAIMDGFLAFSELRQSGSGREEYISKRDLKAFLGSLKEPLSAEHTERFLHFTGNSGLACLGKDKDEVEYESLTEILMTAARAAKA
jgi:Ca2+-binding EF-hand superfamily protein